MAQSDRSHALLAGHRDTCQRELRLSPDSGYQSGYLRVMSPDCEADEDGGQAVVEEAGAGGSCCEAEQRRACQHSAG